MPPNVLFVAPPEEDYLAVTLLHGLRQLLGERVVDYPRYTCAYSAESGRATTTYGRGFSVFFLLPESGCDREDVEQKVRRRHFDLVIFADIWRNWETFVRWRPWLDPQNTVLCDGSDSPQVFPHAGRWWRRPECWQLPRAVVGFLYFKREWTASSQFNLWHRLVPASWRPWLPHYSGLRRTAFSFPAEKIIETVPAKKTLFARHIVDPEVAARVSHSNTAYAFTTEAGYFADLRSARFGVTTRRSGWDCLRHYEIAANGAVPCFRHLAAKPPECAPHGLTPGGNCLAYDSADELLRLTADMPEAEYAKLADGALRWARQNATVIRAAEMLRAWTHRAQ